VEEQFASAGARVITAPAAGFTHIWASSYRGARWALLGREASRLPAHLRALVRSIRDFRPDIVHLNDSPLVPAAIVAKHSGVPVVWHLRAALPPHPGWRSDALRRVVERYSDAAVAINEDVAGSFRLRRGMDVVYNPVDIPHDVLQESDEVTRGRLGLDPSLPVVGMLGNFYPAKGWADLVEAVAILARAGTRAQLAFIGGPVRTAAWHRSPRGRLVSRAAGLEDSESALAAMVEQHSLGGHVAVIPFRRDLAEVYAALDVVCSPSRGPEVGRPIMEGQAHGKAVVATGTSTGAGVIDDGRTGLLAAASDPASLASALSPVLTDREFREALGRAARAKAARDYSPTTSADRVFTVYERLRSGCSS
jgi:glycosyltransferase involved in cell wall biosynthesis